ncbi:hypothetical protein GCM10009087_42130 [Sphingomonas oligophenolica]|uniref:Ferredoxin reductase n=1 Tax=Sphingomonas oligophenolica TaxID=301154 RepID=A0ABU9YCT6_9SPHN
MSGADEVTENQDATASSWFGVRVHRRQFLAPDIVSLELESASGEPLPGWSAGAHVEVGFSNTISRCYSLCGDPDGGGFYRLVIHLELGGVASQLLATSMEEGTRLRIRVSKNDFVLDESAPHSLLIGGGMGVTPLIAMAYRLRRLGRSFVLHFSVRTRARAILVDEFALAFGERFELHSDDGSAGPPIDVAALVEKLPENTAVYFCGPEAFMDMVRQRATQAGVKPERLHAEAFSIRSPRP